MSETHSTDEFDYFNLKVVVDEGAVYIKFFGVDDQELLAMSFDEFRQVIEFVSKYGLGMTASVSRRLRRYAGGDRGGCVSAGRSEAMTRPPREGLCRFGHDRGGGPA